MRRDQAHPSTIPEAGDAETTAAPALHAKMEPGEQPLPLAIAPATVLWPAGYDPKLRDRLYGYVKPRSRRAARLAELLDHALQAERAPTSRAIPAPSESGVVEKGETVVAPARPRKTAG